MWPVLRAPWTALQWALQDRGFSHVEASITGGFQRARSIARCLARCVAKTMGPLGVAFTAERLRRGGAGGGGGGGGGGGRGGLGRPSPRPPPALRRVRRHGSPPPRPLTRI